MSERQKCLDDLDGYINRCQDDISAMLDTLGWTPNHFVQPRTRETCPYNSCHKMSKDSLAKHVPLCKIISQGCSKEDAEKVIEDTSFIYQKSTCVHTEPIDLEKLNAVLWNYHVKNNSVFYGYGKMPLTAKEEERMLSREDRLGLIEFIVKKAKEANRLKELGKDELLVAENLADLVRKDDEERQLDPIEELAAIRDYRRRRQTYRAKNVHITKKSHTEILREVITNQMDMYARSLQDDDAEDPQKDSSEVRNTRSPEGERKQRSYESSNYRGSSRYSGGQYSRRRSRSREDRSESRSQRRRPSADRDRRPKSRDRNRSRSRDRKRSRSRDRYRRNDRKRSRSRNRDRSPNKEDRNWETARNVPQDRELWSHDDAGDIPTTDMESWDDKSRDRSRSHSQERHKKHKHKKIRKKHKKHHGADKSPRPVSPSPDNNDDFTKGFH